MLPYVSKKAYIPYKQFTPAMRRDLTYSQANMDTVRSSSEHASLWGKSSIDVVRLRSYGFLRGSAMVAVPRDWAFRTYSKELFIDRTVFPKSPVKVKHVAPRDAKQQKFFQDIYDQAIRPGPQNILANAGTGSGKSVAVIRLGAMLDTTTLIVVDSNKIAAGFIRNFEKFFGKEWTAKNVGRIQQDRCDYRGKPFAITLVQSLKSRKYEEAMYSYFGLIAFDEVQIFGSSYHTALGLFKARVLLGLTATNKEGQFGALVQDYLGKPAVLSRQEVLKPDAFIVRYRNNKRYNVYSDGTLINSLASDRARNDLLTQIILQRGYKRNRVCLVLSDRVAQLQKLQRSLAKAGVPKKAMGLHVGEYEDTTYTVTYSYGVTQQKLDLRVDKSMATKIAAALSRGSYDIVTGLLPKALYKKLEGGADVKFSVARNTIKPTEDDLDYIANFCHIILATYKIFAKGVDYPRIDMGVEATPYGNITQPLGRTLRLPDGFEKPKPEWYAVHDRAFMGPREGFAVGWEQENSVVETMNHFFDKKASLREKSLLKAKAKIQYQRGISYIGES